MQQQQWRPAASSQHPSRPSHPSQALDARRLAFVRMGKAARVCLLLAPVVPTASPWVRVAEHEDFSLVVPILPRRKRVVDVVVWASMYSLGRSRSPIVGLVKVKVQGLQGREAEKADCTLPHPKVRLVDRDAVTPHSALS